MHGHSFPWVGLWSVTEWAGGTKRAALVHPRRVVDEISWVSTGYVVANVVILPVSGWLSAWFGRRRYYLVSTAVFVLASVGCVFFGCQATRAGAFDRAGFISAVAFATILAVVAGLTLAGASLAGAP